MTEYELREYDKFIEGPKGKEVIEILIRASSIIMSHEPNKEAINMSTVEFRQMFVKCFLRMMIGCDEKGMLINN